MRQLCLCADDFGLSDGVCQGILRLVRQGRLQAVSVLAGGSAWPHWAARLGAEPAVREGRVSVGLHFNLTEGQPLSSELRALWPRYPGLLALLLRAHARRLPRVALQAEWRAQWNAFTAAAGRTPDHVDGHQHVHHLPQVRDIVLAGVLQGWPDAHQAQAQAQAPSHRPAVRSTAPLLGSGHGFKRWVIAHSGGRALERALLERGLPHNLALTGAYDFAATDYRGLMQAWLARIPARGGLLFCHPGQADATTADAIAEARARELAYLGSPAFAHDLAAAGVVLGPAW